MLHKGSEGEGLLVHDITSKHFKKNLQDIMYALHASVLIMLFIEISEWQLHSFSFFSL